MKQRFRELHLSNANILKLATINRIIESYQAQGYRLTLRQLYYQLVSSDIVPNKAAEYDKLSVLLKEGRMAGFVDWDAIEDRLRRPDRPAFWSGPDEILDACIRQYRCDRMQGQDTYLEVWVEKDALSGVLKRVTYEYGISIVVNRGYSSVTAMFDAHERFERAVRYGAKEIKVIYIGDFDPSGQDMIRDIRDRIQEFNTGSDDSNYSFDIVPIALTWAQIQQYTPPPNPAKVTDPRAEEYMRKHGDMSWEVDALKPEVLNEILTSAILEHLDFVEYGVQCGKEEEHKTKLIALKSQL